MNDIYIYGMGRRGLEIYFILKDNNYVNSVCFIDRDRSKCHIYDENIKCIHTDFLNDSNLSKDSFIIVSNKKVSAIMDELRELGFYNIKCWDAIKSKFNNHNVIICDEHELGRIFKQIKEQNQVTMLNNKEYGR